MVKYGVARQYAQYPPATGILSTRSRGHSSVVRKSGESIRRYGSQTNAPRHMPGGGRFIPAVMNYCQPAGGTPHTRKVLIPDPDRLMSQLFCVFTETRYGTAELTPAVFSSWVVRI